MSSFCLLCRVLYPMNKQSRHQTTVKWKTVSPEFNEQFVYLTSVTELPKQNLHITVWDRGKDRPDKYIGKIQSSNRIAVVLSSQRKLCCSNAICR